MFERREMILRPVLLTIFRVSPLRDGTVQRCRQASCLGNFPPIHINTLDHLKGAPPQIARLQ
jgi:hypothetical protein